MDASSLLGKLWWQGLGITMLDFLLWGSVLGSLLCMVGALLLRGASAQTRYRYFSSSLILMVVMGFALLADQLKSPTGISTTIQSANVTSTDIVSVVATPMTGNSLPRQAFADVADADSLPFQVPRFWLHYLPFLWGLLLHAVPAEKCGFAQCAAYPPANPFQKLSFCPNIT